MRDANLTPVDAIVLLSEVVLIAGDVNAVDMLRGVDGSLALIHIVFPLADAHHTVGI